MKIFADGQTGLSWKRAKGKAAINMESCAVAYTHWWREWIAQEDLISVLQASSGLSDMFGQAGHLCQAEVLWSIRNDQT